MHKDGLGSRILHHLFVHLISLQIPDALRPDFVRLTHGYPNIGADHVRTPGSGFHILGQCNAAAAGRSQFLTLFHQFPLREIFCAGAGRKMHPQFGAQHHQGITRIISGISHVCETDPLQMPEMLSYGQRVRQHLGGMKFIG